MYASLCDFVCIALLLPFVHIALLLPFVLGFCLPIFFFLVYFLVLVIIGGFVF